VEERLHEVLFPVAYHLEFGRECVHCLRSDSVEAYGKLEYVIRVFSARIDFAHAVDDFTQGYPAAVIPHCYFASPSHDLDRIALAHDKLVYAVVDHFLEKHVNAVLRMASVAESSTYIPVRRRMCSRASRVLMVFSS